MHGKGEYQYSSGAKYEGDWKNGQKHGTGTFIRFLVGKRPLGQNSRLKFAIFLRLNYNIEIQFLKIYQNRQISIVFCHKKLSNLKPSARQSIFVPHSRSNQSSLAYIFRSQLFNSIFTWCLSD